MKKRQAFAWGLPVAALILEMLPYGVEMKFMNPNGDPWIKKTSYFDLLPVGYANVSPFLTAILTCLLLILAVIFAAKKSNKILKAGTIVSLIAAIISVCPVIFSAYSLIGVLISVCLAGETLCLFWIRKKGKIIPNNPSCFI